VYVVVWVDDVMFGCLVDDVVVEEVCCYGYVGEVIEGIVSFCLLFCVFV